MAATGSGRSPPTIEPNGAAMTAELQDKPQPDLTVEEVPKTPDLEVILAEPGSLEIAGIAVQVNRIRANEFFALINVLTAGLEGRMGAVMENLQEAEGGDETQAALVTMFVLAVPKALPEFAQFLRTITHARQESDRARLALELENPDPGDLLDILGVLAVQEKDDLYALVGKARAWISKIGAVYQKPAKPTAG
jgi:hypothetical protein